MKERKKHFGKKTRDLCEETGSLVESDCHEPDKEQSKEILCITNAAVNALSSVKDAAAEKKPDLRGGSAPKIPAPQERIIVDSAPLHINQNHQSSSSDLANMSNSSSESSRVADAINSEKRRKSGSPFELSFNGTQRVRVPSRLLREIKSPLERGSSSGESTEVPGTTGDESWSSVPVTVVRHVDGPLAWIPSVITDPSDAGRPPKILETNKEPSRDCVTSHSYEVAQLIDRAVETRVDGRLVEEMVAAAETGGRRKNSLVKGLHQGEPKSGMPVFCPEDENPSGMKVRTFALSDKEKTLKETFLRRQEQRRPLKRLVHPTVVSEPQSEGHDKREADNPVVAAAAIAAAAASAATGPFLQLQHSLEAQVTALLSNLQVLQQNQNKKQELQEKEQERKLQLQINERLQRLEDLQKKMLEAQSIPTGHVSSSAVPRHPSSVLHSVHPMTDHMTMASLHGVPVASTTHTARGVSIGDERPQIQYPAAGRFEPHTTHAGPFNPEDPLSYSRALPPASKHKAVRNTRTQTSPQESLSSNDSPLQTPLPRKRPPVPISRYDMPRSRVKGHRSDATRRVDRVQSEPALPSGLPSYREKMTGKGRGLLEQLVSKESAVRGRVIYPSACDVAIETRTAANRTDAAPLKSETVAVLNEVGKIKTELRDILTEADKLKQGLIQQQVEKGAAHSSKSLFRRTDPSPLDEYLVEAACGPSVPEDSRTVTPTGFLPVQRSSVHHFADAEHILKDVQRRRENLENNLEAVERQREEQDLYNLVDNIPLSTGEFDGMLRIRRDVDKKIEELTSAVQREIEQDNRMAPIQRDASSPLNKPKSQGVKTSLSRATGAKRSLSTGPPDLGKRGVKKNEGKENLPEKGVLKKSKPAAKTAAPPKKSSKLTPAQKQDYVSSVYGRQPYQPQRTTSKAPYLHYHSPVNPKTAAVMAGLMAGANRVAGKPVPLQDLTSLPVKEAVEPKKTKADARKQWLSPREQPAKQNDSTRYFFHPTVDLSQVGSREGRSRVAVPMEGQLVPMAIPLGKPKTDPALRPPVATNAVQGTSEMQAQPPSPSTDSTSSGLSPVPTPARSAPVPGHSRSAQSNVAVITVYDKELGDQTDQQQKQRSKSPAKKRKKQSSLNVQVLPTVDIDSYSESSYSSPRPPFIDDIPEPLSRPHDSEYQEFRNYLAVTDMESGPQERKEEQPEDQEDDFHSIPTPQNYLTLEGLTAMDGRPYNGPPFPPEHPSMPPHPSGGVLEADARQEEALQERAMEWIEQELLARIVSEMNQPLPDPTSLARPQPTPERSSMSEAEDEDADMLAATIGLGGIQLFIDAGLPVDRHLVNDLIREVIEEKVTTVLGHPKPRASLLPSRQETLNEDHPSATPSPRGTPLSTPVPTPDYTPPESEESAHESAVLATPECTPTPSVSSEELSPSDAREEPFEPIHEEPDPEEKTSEQVSEVRTPVATPVPTPPGDRSSPVSIATPEPSIREPEWSEQGTVVTTPPPSVVVQTSTPEPEPEPETNVTEEPSSPEEPSVSVTKLTPPKPAQPSVSSPSTTSTLSTRGTTTVTTEEELSEGEMIQPYVHTGMYSEGEFAVFPDIVQLAVERKLPVGGDWDSMLGGDEDSRNELVRVALNGILHHGEGEERRGLGEREGSSSSSSESPDQQSTASTLRDTDDIKEDSITDVTQSEGEVRFQDPMAILLTRIQQHMRSAENSVSEGELLPEHLRTPDRGHRATGLETDPKTVPGPGDVSPGEVVWEQPVPSHGESTPGIKSQGQAAVENQPNKVVVAPRAAETEDISVGEPSHHDRSLHASDLLPGTLGTDFSLPSTQQTFTTPKVIYVEQQDSEPEQSHSNSPRTYSLDEDRRAGTTVVEEEDAKGPAVSTAIGSRDRSTQAEKREDVNGREEKESEPQLPTRIQVTLPSMNDIHETSVESEALVDIEQDTFGDVSSISGGDF